MPTSGYNYISEMTLKRTGFNYWEPSLILNKDLKYRYVAHIGGNMMTPSLENKSLVVIERYDDQKIERYFGVIEGKPLGKRDEAGADEFMEQLLGIVTRKNRIAARDLETKLLEYLK